MKDGRWRTYLPDSSKKYGRRAITYRCKEDLETAIIEFYEENNQKRKKKKITFRDLYPEWLEYKRLHSGTDSYIYRINADFKKYYQDDPIIDKPLRKLKKLELDNWLHFHIREYEMTKKQYYNFSLLMRQLLDYAVDKEIIKSNPIQNIKVDSKLFRREKKKPDNTQVFTRDEVRLIEQLAWEDYYNRSKKYQLAPLAVLFQFQTGVRIGELCTLRYEDITGNYIHIQRMLQRYPCKVVSRTKTSCGDREIYLTETARSIIKACQHRQKELGVETDGYIFSIIDGRPLSYISVEDSYTKYCKEIGIPHKSSHKARKTFISALIDSAVNINTIRQMAGHSDERTTYNSYVFDRHPESEKNQMIEEALNNMK